MEQNLLWSFPRNISTNYHFLLFFLIKKIHFILLVYFQKKRFLPIYFRILMRNQRKTRTARYYYFSMKDINIEGNSSIPCAFIFGLVRVLLVSLNLCIVRCTNLHAHFLQVAKKNVIFQLWRALQYPNLFLIWHVELIKVVGPQRKNFSTTTISSPKTYHILSVQQ